MFHLIDKVDLMRVVYIYILSLLHINAYFKQRKPGDFLFRIRLTIYIASLILGNICNDCYVKSINSKYTSQFPHPLLLHWERWKTHNYG